MLTTPVSRTDGVHIAVECSCRIPRTDQWSCGIATAIRCDTCTACDIALT